MTHLGRLKIEERCEVAVVDIDQAVIFSVSICEAGERRFTGSYPDPINAWCELSIVLF